MPILSAKQLQKLYLEDGWKILVEDEIDANTGKPTGRFFYRFAKSMPDQSIVLICVSAGSRDELIKELRNARDRFDVNDYVGHLVEAVEYGVSVDALYGEAFGQKDQRYKLVRAIAG